MRFVIRPFDECFITLHYFSIASKVSYVACFFLCVSFEGKSLVQLVLCNSKVTSAKEVTVLILEFFGALVTARLYYQVIDALKTDKMTRTLLERLVCSSDLDHKRFPLEYFHDKLCCWNKRLHKSRRLVQPFILVTQFAEILSLALCARLKYFSWINWAWLYVSGSDDPADLPSRGCNVKVLLKSRWWERSNCLKQELDKKHICIKYQK